MRKYLNHINPEKEIQEYTFHQMKKKHSFKSNHSYLVNLLLIEIQQKVSFCKLNLQTTPLFSASRPKKIFFAITSLIIYLFGFSNCAAFNRKNTPLIRAVENNLVPEKYPNKVLLAPVYLPIGIAGGILDIFIIHPALQIKPSFLETKNFLWKIKFNGYFSEMGSLPVRAAFSPVFFSLGFLFRSAFDLDSDFEYSAANQEKKESIENLLEQKNTTGIINWIYSTQISIKEKDTIQKIFKEYPATSDSGIYPSLVGKLCGEKLYGEYEDFLISLFPSNSNSNLTYCFTRQKSKKFSRVLLKTIMSSELPPEKFQEYLVVLLNINDTEDIKTLRVKIQK